MTEYHFEKQLLSVLLKKIVDLRQSLALPVVAISGPTAVGKSTLSAALAAELRSQFHLSAVVLSLDDFYLSKLERQQRAQDWHPLFITRGVPGTHDIDLLLQVLRAILSSSHTNMCVPRFSKLQDDRLPATEWFTLPEKIDLVLLEGWCLGASVQTDAELAMPMNQFEREFDADAGWRHQVNCCLATQYQSLFSLIDQYILLTVDDFADVFLFREQQEQTLLVNTGQRQMSSDQVVDFVYYFERITRQMLSQFQHQNTVRIHCDLDRHYYLTK